MTGTAIRGGRGFTLLEALVALLLAAILFAAVALYAGSWLGTWSRLTGRGAQEDIVAIVLDRIVEDLEEAQPYYQRGLGGEQIAFTGEEGAVTFVRPALGFNARPGLDRVTYLNGQVGRETAVLRSRRDFADTGGGEDLPLIRGVVRVSFAYAGADGSLSGQWSNPTRLPSMVRVELSGSSPRPWRQSGYALIRAEMPANCGSKDSFAACRARLQGQQ